MEQDLPYELTRHLASAVWKMEFCWFNNVSDTHWPAPLEQIVARYLKGRIDGLLFVDVECIEPFSKSLLDLSKFAEGKTLRLFVWK